MCGRSPRRTVLRREFLNPVLGSGLPFLTYSAFSTTTESIKATKGEPPAQSTSNTFLPLISWSKGKPRILPRIITSSPTSNSLPFLSVTISRPYLSVCYLPVIFFQHLIDTHLGYRKPVASKLKSQLLRFFRLSVA